MSIALNLLPTELAESCRLNGLTEPLVDIAASWVLFSPASCMHARIRLIRLLTICLQPAKSGRNG
jgi:hypothetical protein